MLKGKNIIITGANRGIGYAIVNIFAHNGANIWACARSKNPDMEFKFNALSKECGVWIKPVYFELGDYASMEQGLKYISQEKLQIDVLVNNAGVTSTALLHEISIDNIKKIFEINFFSQLYIIQKISKLMIRKKTGNIINMASVAGIEHQPGRIAYGASKSSIIWATQSLAKEFSPFNIRVNAIAPGAVKTQMTSIYSEKKINKIVSEICLGRLAEPQEIAEVALFLASDKSMYINGEIIKVDGGR